MSNKYCSSLVPCIAMILLCGSGSLLLAQRRVTATGHSKHSSPPAPPASDSTSQKGEPIGKRIIFADGATLDVDDSWKQGDTIWYRLNGTSQSLVREVRSIETRFKEASTSNKLTGASTVAAPKVPAAAPGTWIYLVCRLLLEKKNTYLRKICL